MPRRASLPLVLALVACDSPNAPSPLSARLPAMDLWSGGEVSVVAATFRPPAQLPLVQLGTQTLTTRRVNDSTIAARLPDADGPFALRVELSGFEPFTAGVVLYGFRGATTGPLLSGFLYPLPSQPHVLGAGDQGLVEVDVRTGMITRAWPDTVHSPDCTWGVGPSVRPGYFVAFGKAPGGGCTHPWVWQYGTQLVRADSLWGYPDIWAVAEIGPGGVIAGADDNVTVSHCDATGCTDRLWLSRGFSLTGVTIAPAAGRAVLHQFFAMVVDARTGDSLYRLPPVTGHHTNGAAFSADEDTLYAVGDSYSGSRLVMVASADGAPLDSVGLPGLAASDIARDPVRGWLYVAAIDGNLNTPGPLRLLILEEGTLAPVAALRAPSEVVDLTAWHLFRIVLDQAMNSVYVVATKQVYDAHGVSARIARFGLLPP